MNIENQKTEEMKEDKLREYVKKLQIETAYLRLTNGNLLFARDTFERLHMEACEDAARQASRVRDVARRMSHIL